MCVIKYIVITTILSRFTANMSVQYTLLL
jgi:hypothetical protein